MPYRHCLFTFWLTCATLWATTAYADSESPPAPQSMLFERDALYVLSLLRADAVQTELRLSETQSRDIQQLTKELVEVSRPLLIAIHEADGHSKSGLQKQLREITSTHAITTRTFIHEELSDPQLQRLKQIYWQQIGPAALSDNEITAALSLSRTQLTTIARVQVEIQKWRAQDIKAQRQADLEAGVKRKPRGIFLRRPSAAFTARAMAELTAALTKSQRETFMAKLGTPFDAGGTAELTPTSSVPAAEAQRTKAAAQDTREEDVIVAE